MGSPSSTDPLRLGSREEWRGWLEEHHGTDPAVWLLVRRKHAGVPGVSYEEAVEEALCFGWIDGQGRRLNEESFLLRFSPRRPRSLWSLSNVERVERLTAAGKMAPAGLEQVERARQDGRWDRAYTSRTSPALPTDLQAALSADPPAGQRFAHLSHSAQTMYAVWVAEAKRPQTRARRIAEVLRRCRPGD